MRDFRHSVSLPRTAGTELSGRANPADITQDLSVDIPPIEEQSQLGKEIREMLHEDYVLMETMHLRSSLERVSGLRTQQQAWA